MVISEVRVHRIVNRIAIKTDTWTNISLKQNIDHPQTLLYIAPVPLANSRSSILNAFINHFLTDLSSTQSQRAQEPYPHLVQ